MKRFQLSASSTRAPGRRRTPSRAAVTVAAMMAVSIAAVSGCGRSATVDALDPDQGEPEIAGVSITSPDAVVATNPAAQDETSEEIPASSVVETLTETVYVVQPGDTLGVIASQHDVTTEALAAHNGIGNVNTISPGQELRIPPAPVVVVEETTTSTTATSTTATTVSG